MCLALTKFLPAAGASALLLTGANGRSYVEPAHAFKGLQVDSGCCGSGGGEDVKGKDFCLPFFCGVSCAAASSLRLGVY